MLWAFGLRYLVISHEYEYPASSITWKNNMLVTQTPAEPPKTGNNAFATMGCTENSKTALHPMVME